MTITSFHGPCRRAFTLIELLLAITIFAVVLSAINVVFFGAVRLRNHSSDAMDTAVAVQHAVTIMKNDLANIVLPGGTMFGELQTTTGSSVFTSTASTTSSSSSSSSSSSASTPSPQILLPGQVGPTICTASGTMNDDLPWGEIEKVSYTLVDSTNRAIARFPGKDLRRAATRNLLSSATVQPPPDEDQWLISGVQSVNFLFYDGTQWRDYWDSTTETNKLPYGIKVQIAFAPPDRFTAAPKPLEIIVPVVLQVSTNDMTTATQ